MEKINYKLHAFIKDYISIVMEYVCKDYPYMSTCMCEFKDEVVIHFINEKYNEHIYSISINKKSRIYELLPTYKLAMKIETVNNNFLQRREIKENNNNEIN